MESAILREKHVKRWPRAWKYDLIHKDNPTWRDLPEDFGFEPLILCQSPQRKAGPGSRPG
jgi:putative endonuclease